ncbi:MAG: glycosyltransferase family 39 protein [Anaerolineae bacterium]
MSDAADRRPGLSMHVPIAWALVPVLGVALLLRFVDLSRVPLIGDECYYWLWSRNLDWAYYDNPSGVAFLVRAGRALAGSGAWGIRWLNALLGAGCVFLTYQVGQRLVSRRAGLWASATIAVAAPYLITSRFVYTDVLFLVLVLISILAFWRLATGSGGMDAGIALGVALAALFNTKYSAYAFGAALILAVLIDHRHLVRTDSLWVGVLVGCLGLLPVLIWNGVHDWASFRWQFSHATRAIIGVPSLVGNARHAWVYLTPPLCLIASLGLGRVRNPAERLLSLAALFQLVPVALSPANSPRNLTTGMVPLLILAGTRLPPDLSGGHRRLLAGFLLVGLLATGLYGVGTVADLAAPSRLPSSSHVPEILHDAAGWPAIGRRIAEGTGPVFAIDYSVAAKVRYYAARPATTSWGQYRIWGIPDLDQVTVVALDYLPADWVTVQLGEAFETLVGPECLSLAAPSSAKKVHIWQAKGLRLEEEQFLRQFDFLTLLEAAP